jgi:hypothetical protein
MEEKVKLDTMSLHTKVFDFRLFDVQTFSSPVIFIFHLSEVHQKMFDFIADLDCITIHSDKLLTQKEYNA